MRLAGSLMICWLIGCGEPAAESLSADDVESVEVRLTPFDRPIPEPVRSMDREIIQSLLESLKPVDEAPKHKCGPVGELVIVRRSGKAITLFFLPGHDRRFYEYGGQGKVYRVDREKFAAAMAKLKVNLPADPGTQD